MVQNQIRLDDVHDWISACSVAVSSRTSWGQFEKMTIYRTAACCSLERGFGSFAF